MRIAAILEIFTQHGLLVESQALQGIDEIGGEVRVDNRKLEPGDIFVCIRGQVSDGHSFIGDAREKGVALVVCENEFGDDKPAIRVSDSRKATALLAKLQFKNPSSAFRLIGVTGTNGKTTTSMLLFKAIHEIGFSAGWIGTLGYWINDEHFETRHTTPDILELNGIFARMAQRGLKYVFMEVSSHALALDRVYGLEFDFCLFTNLSHEHLDFHENMESYGQAKLQLFDATLDGKAVGLFNIDDDFGAKACADLKKRGAYVFSLGHENADYVIREDLAKTAAWDQSRFSLQCQEGVINIRSALAGGFNVSNLALSAAALNLMGFENRQIEQGLNCVKAVQGRFEQVPNRRGIGVFVDYAHTPDALENVLSAARQMKPKRLLCLLGAGGERDRGKRPLMLKAALNHADAVIVTDDNPRGENPNTIVREIVAGSDFWLPWWIIRDRNLAIGAILGLAQPGEIVLLCGKGHENYQEIEGVRHHFDDAEVATGWLESEDLGRCAEHELAMPVERLMLELICEAETQDTQGYEPPEAWTRVSTDSRVIEPGSIFFALSGLNFDGNAYLGEVLRDGSNFGIGNIGSNGWKHYLRVERPVEAMASLHRKYLQMFGAYRVAITGSTGKTSTKELLAQVLGAAGPCLKTLANSNNIIGLCQTIARIRPQHEHAVFELGTNAFGEIAQLAEVCAPDAGIILNIGPSHLEFLIDEMGVFKEKSALFDRPLQIRLYDADDQRFSGYDELGMSVGFSEAAKFCLSDVICADQSCDFRLNKELFTIPYSAPWIAKNAAFAVALGMLRDIPLDAIRQAVTVPITLENRLQREDLPHRLLLIDCYNANPVSMQAAIEYWHTLEPGREHIAILGDMLELGDSAESYHDMIGAILGEKGYDRLFTVGNLSMRFHSQDSCLQNRHFASSEELLSSGVLDDIQPGAVVLVKASNSIHLEKLLPRLRSDK
ncbi:MAG: UDP-N-acetylmuramoyl-L-alanyl-D-glutamate--2,6-diaminopimelate ligase [Candidatus Cloacimonadaceae bacterium]|nr:UDP-N-acetylmuramoyl-L-alanyl-D-glutamate--2,6-diaminopimelate ligase [Candidatus Cloacimonadota bacterium]MDX9950352.1 UDP-N-acetylmuramoyl-L-alanyl-D-glutamate--2,6-diaminopimelate ligase [Candidatus Syntrophosphaera sp.]